MYGESQVFRKKVNTNEKNDDKHEDEKYKQMQFVLNSHLPLAQYHKST